MPTLLNRSAVLVVPKESFCDWLQSKAPADDPESLKSEIQENPNVYLIDEVDGPVAEAVKEAMEKCFVEIAMHEFFSWWSDENDWPVLRNLEEFEQYFSWRCHELVVDVSSDDFILDDLE